MKNFTKVFFFLSLLSAGICSAAAEKIEFIGSMKFHQEYIGNNGCSSPPVYETDFAVDKAITEIFYEVRGCGNGVDASIGNILPNSPYKRVVKKMDPFSRSFNFCH